MVSVRASASSSSWQRMNRPSPLICTCVCVCVCVCVLTVCVVQSRSVCTVLRPHGMHGRMHAYCAIRYMAGAARYGDYRYMWIDRRRLVRTVRTSAVELQPSQSFSMSCIVGGTLATCRAAADSQVFSRTLASDVCMWTAR